MVINNFELKKCYQGFSKKSGSSFFSVLQYLNTLKSWMKTAHLLLLMESDGNFVNELCDNFTYLSSTEDYNFLPFDVEEIGVGDRFNWMLEDSMKTRVSASAETVQATKRLRTMSDEKREVAEAQIKVF